MNSSIQARVIEDLQNRIRGMESSHHRAAAEDVHSTGFAALDRLLGDRGLGRGMLVEWLAGSEGSGAVTLALCVAAHILREEGAFIVIDETGDFYPVAATHLGIPLDRTAIVRPESPATALWAWEQSLRCPGVAVTFGRIGVLDGHQFRRLQLAVESGEGLGFLVRPPAFRAGASWAATRIRVSSSPYRLHARNAESFVRRLRASVSRGFSGAGETEIELELPHETDDVPVVPELAGAMANHRAAVG